MSVEAALQRELAGPLADLAGTALAESALAMAEIVDNPKNSATSRTMAQARLQAALDELRALVPPERKDDKLDELHARRRRRLERRPGAPA